MYNQKNIEQLFAIIGSIPNQKFVRTKHFEFIKTKENIWPNQIINLDANESNINQILDSIELESSQNIIPNLLMCNPVTDSISILNSIKDRNYKSSSWTAMSFNLIQNEIKPLKYNITIKLVRSKNDFSNWLKIVEAELMNYGILNSNIFNSLLQRKECYFFLGFENNQPVATSFLFKGSDNAGVYLVSTLKTHRKKGIGTQMTHRCIKLAKALNSTCVQLQATDSGKKVYESLGFKNDGIINVFRIERS